MALALPEVGANMAEELLSWPGAALAVLYRGVMCLQGWVLLSCRSSPIMGRASGFHIRPGTASPRAGRSRRSGRALNTPWLITARSSDGGLVGADAPHTCEGSDTSPPGTPGLAAPSPGAGKLLHSVAAAPVAGGRLESPRHGVTGSCWQSGCFPLLNSAQR